MARGVGDGGLLGAEVGVAVLFEFSEFFFFKSFFSFFFFFFFLHLFLALFLSFSLSLSLSPLKKKHQTDAPRPDVLLVEVDHEVAVVLQHGLGLAAGRHELLALVEHRAGADEGLGNHFLGVLEEEEEEEEEEAVEAV